MRSKSVNVATVLKAAGAVGIGLIGLLVVGWFGLRTPDVPREVLIDRYGGPPGVLMRLESGDEVHLRDTGPRGAPVLVLLHGSNASLHTWEPLTWRLETSYRIVSLDLPAHGLTGPVKGQPYGQRAMAGFVFEVLDHLSLQRVSVAGNSMGGAVALIMAEEAPERVTSLILIDSSGGRDPDRRDRDEDTDRPFVYELAVSPFFAPVIEKITPRWLAEDGLYASFSDDSLVTDEMIDRYWELARLPGSRRATLQRFRGYVAGDPLRIDFARVDAPTLVIWGADDRLIPVSNAAFFQSVLDVRDSLILPDVGHLPQEEAVDQVAQQMRRFLGRHALTETSSSDN